MEHHSSSRFAAIDLGTNTFHVIIADAADNGNFRELFRERVFVNLAEEGIETIAPAPYQRALDAVAFLKTQLDAFGVKRYRVFGTAALRTASNGVALINDIRKKTGITVQLIDGAEEARLIYLGVRQAVPLQKERALIMDIGGGSVEFILTEAEKVLWSKSYPVGVAVLYKRFHHTDPITEQEINQLLAFLEEQLGDLRTVLGKYPADTLIGASGTFDVLEKMLAEEKDSSSHYSAFPVSLFPDYCRQVILSTLAERLEMPSIPASRAKMIVVAILLIRYVLPLSPIRKMLISSYAMKEGILYELMAQK